MKLWETKNLMSGSSFVTSSEIVYLRALLPYCAGIALAKLSSPFLILLTTLQISAGILFLLLLFSNVFYSQLRLYRFKIHINIATLVLLFCTGYISAIIRLDIYSNEHFNRHNFNYLKIKVDQEPQKRKAVLLFKAQVISGYENNAKQQTIGNVLVSIKVDPVSPLDISYGDILIIPNLVTETRSNPNPATFDYKAWLETQHIFHQIFVFPDDIILLKRNEGQQIIRWALSLRERQVKYFRKILKNDDVYSVACTLILGYRLDLGEELLSYYSKTGTIHALSVSGMHVGLIYLVLNWIFQYFNRNRFTKVCKICIILIIIWMYTILTGLSPSVLRAAIMLSVFMIGKGINRSANGINILAFSALIILVYDPLTIGDVGFQLSYLAVLGLITVQPLIEKWFYFKNVLIQKIWSAISISLAAQLFTFPLSVYYFHQFPVYFILSNLFILIPVTAVMYLGIVILLFRLSFLADILEWLIAVTNAGLKFIAELPYSTVSAIWLSGVDLLLMMVVLAGLLLGLSRYKKQLIFYSLFICVGLQILFAFDKIKKLNQRQLIIFNIKGLHAIAFIAGQEAIVYSPLKLSDKLFKRNIQPYLDQRWISSIICSNNLSDIRRPYFYIAGDEIQFFDYTINKFELQNFKMGYEQAIIKDID